MAGLKTPEIMAPVASWEMCQAAVHNGADAIYIGAPHFNARGRTPDFGAADLKLIIDYCHLYGVKVFVAFNVLIFERELEAAEALLRELLPLGADALIVQDLGLARLIHALAPRQAIHGSTQMTVSSAEAIEATADLEIERYVLARELSIAELERIRPATEKELEVFVHGALCVSYSGQCLTSESSGGRSANRGQCAQSCRFPFALFVDGKEKPMGDKRYLASPQDLCGLEDVPRLLRAGVDSFKIEGRLKAPEYVASTVRNYREAAEAAAEDRELDAEPRLQELALTFARGRFNGWYDGVNHQKLVDARIARPSGIYLGKVLKVEGQHIEIDIEPGRETAIAPGDGVVFYIFEREVERGGIVFSAREVRRGVLRIRLGEEFPTEGIQQGMEVFHNSSSMLDKKLRQSYYDKKRKRRVLLRGKLSGRIGEELCYELEDGSGNRTSIYSSEPLEPAKTSPLTAEDAESELGALGGTAFLLEKLEFAVKGRVFVHNRELKRLRREAVRALIQARTASNRNVNIEEQVPALQKSDDASKTVNQEEPTLHVLIRDESQLAAIAGQRIGTVYLDYDYNKDCEQSLALLRDMGIRTGIATTRILKPGELGHLKYIERIKPDAVLVRNLGALHYLRNSGFELIGDFSLNAANSLTVNWVLSKGLTRLSPSYDLNQSQLLELADASPKGRLEVTIHQYMPAFHMEHCVFAAFLSSGTTWRDCGRPCERHRVELRDPDGTLHPVRADAECRNTMFQGRAQSAARLIAPLSEKGVSAFRIEALFETAEELRAKIAAYSAVIYGRAEPESVFSKLGLIERYGVTEGQLFNVRDYQDRKKQLLKVIPAELAIN